MDSTGTPGQYTWTGTLDRYTGQVHRTGTPDRYNRQVHWTGTPGGIAFLAQGFSIKTYCQQLGVQLSHQ